MKVVKIILLSWLLVLLPLFLFTQEKPYILLTEENGLANNDVRDITRDNKGFLWIATSNGLSKYDGEKFTNFGIKEGMPGKWVWAVEHDEKDRIYAACYTKGLVIIENDRIKKILHVKANKDDTFRKLYFSQKHQVLFVGTDFGIYGLKDTTLYLISYPNAPKEKSSILCIKENDGTIFFTVHNTYANGGLYRIDVDTTNFSESKVRKIVGGGQGTGCDIIDDDVYFNLNSTIYRYSKNIEKTDSLYQTYFQISTWSLSSFGNNFIALGGIGQNRFMAGLKIFDLTKKQILESPYKFDGVTINNLVHNKNSNSTWVCSNIGLAYIDNSSPFEFYEKGDDSVIKDIETVNDSIFVLTDKDVWLLYNSELKPYLKYSDLDRIAHKKLTEYFNKAKLKKVVNKNWKLQIMDFNETVIPLNFAKEDNQLYLTTSLGTISFPDFKNFLPVIDGHFIKNDNYGRSLWIPGYDSLRYSENGTDPFYNNYFEPKSRYKVRSIFKVLKARDVVYFASSFDGIFAIRGNQVFNLNSKNSPIGDNLTDIETDNEGNLWCINSTRNLFKLELDDSLYVIREFNEHNSYIVGDSYKWLKFNKNFLYIGTNKGLNKIPTGQLEKERIDSVSFYNQFNGYNFISAESPVTDTEGNMYVHTAGKIIRINSKTPVQPLLDLKFQEILVDGQNYLFDDFNTINLKSSTENIRMIFSAFKMPTSKNIEYRYRVNEGVWEKGNIISLQSLKPDNYKITCEAKDIETSVNYQRDIQFIINQPFWLNHWFIAFFTLIVAGITYLLLKGYFTKQKRQQDERNRINAELNDLHIKSLQSQMNPHFIFNSLNSIQNFILSNNTEDALNYLGTLGGIIRMNLENISEEYIPLAIEIEFLKKYINVEKMRFKKLLDIKIINQIDDLDKFRIPPMLIQPLIENAIKHGVRPLKYKGKISVDFTNSGDCLIVTVTDNGIGREKASASKNQNQKSIGLSLIVKRLDLLNQKNKTDKFRIEITDLFEDGNPAGTKVELSIPQTN